MKTVLLLLVALAGATGPARALHCHVCSNSINCKNSQACPAGSHFCRTMIKVEPLRGNLVEKSCVEVCKPSYHLQGQVSSGAASTFCCQEDLCNTDLHSRAPPHAATSSTRGLVLTLGLIALLLVPGL